MLYHGISIAAIYLKRNGVKQKIWLIWVLNLCIVLPFIPTVSQLRHTWQVSNIYPKSPIFTRSLLYLPGASRIYLELPVFTWSLPYLPGASCINQSEFGMKIAIISYYFLICSYGISEFIKTESPVFLVLQLVMYGLLYRVWLRWKDICKLNLLWSIEA